MFTSTHLIRQLKTVRMEHQICINLGDSKKLVANVCSLLSTLYEEQDDRALGPVTWFLARALVDSVFEDVSSVDDKEIKAIPSCVTKHIAPNKSGMDR
jgi:hypothetical protein